jgi:hypothetical protein
VVSILLAFGIQAWWEGRGDAEVYADYVSRFESDLRQDTALLSYLTEGMGRKRAALEALRDSPGEVDLPSALLQAEQFGWGQFTFSGTTFEDLRSTGNLRLIGDSQLRAALVDYYELWGFEQGRISSRRSDLPALVFKLLPIHFETADGAGTVDPNAEGDLRQLGGSPQPSLRETLESPQLRLELQHELNYAGFATAALQRLEADAVALLHLLERPRD